ncbi:ABC transporter ATP-binding protein [Rapidithrix thailandica]|uniref:ABC transporter ATP-binding protein n=1 Tax=Rapidithrix thailandica TaxID=413964 RepID=A0AAW9S9W8_9BACT
MTEIVIDIHQLGKSYLIGHHNQVKHNALRDVIVHGVQSFTQKFKYLLNGNQPILSGDEVEEFWALRNLSFSVEKGDKVGIIGRNGAGKSTLLKLLSRITEPTEGEIRVKGRVASLLEVGTGFHPELTGRENIFLNGAILGMTRAEVKRKFDEIVEFSEVEKFLDTPVKRYSSGMYVRLAFAIAAHLEPEILVVDEVLAVGDTKFQKKCLGKMEDVANQGRTVLFVSHNMGTIKTLCNKGVLLQQGQLIYKGDIDSVVQKYLESVQDTSISKPEVHFEPNVQKEAQLVSARIFNQHQEPCLSFDVFDKIFLEFTYDLHIAARNIVVQLQLERNGEMLFYSFDTDVDPDRLERREPGRYQARVELPTPLKAGLYTLNFDIGVYGSRNLEMVYDLFSFEIEERSFNSRFKSYAARKDGKIVTHLKWTQDCLSPVLRK